MFEIPISHLLIDVCLRQRFVGFTEGSNSLKYIGKALLLVFLSPCAVYLLTVARTRKIEYIQDD